MTDTTLYFLLGFLFVGLFTWGILTLIQCICICEGTSIKELWEKITDNITDNNEDEKPDPKTLEEELSRERQRELLIDYCRRIVLNPGNRIEREFNAQCLMILESNPKICTIEELMIELDKMNLMKDLLKGDQNEKI